MPVARTVTFDPLNLLIVIDPTDPLGVSATYTVELTAGVLAVVGGTPLTPVTYTFTAGSNADETPPTFPTANFGLNARATDSITLQWDAAAGATAYEIFVIPSNGIFDPTADPDATPAGLTHMFSGLDSDVRFEYRIRAVDGAGNISAEFHPFLTKTLTDWSQDVYAEIISNRCLLCHVPMGAETPPFFMATQAEAYSNLAGPTNDVFCATSPVPKRVVPSDHANSFLWMKISMSPPPCGDRMPRDGMTNPLGYLSDTQIQTIKDWINEGALDN